MLRSQWLAGVALLVFAATALAGCGSGDQIVEDARSLVPPEATVVEERAHGCGVLTERTPDCVYIYFETPSASRAEREAMFVSNAEENGWHIEERKEIELSGGGVKVEFVVNRDGRDDDLRVRAGVYPDGQREKPSCQGTVEPSPVGCYDFVEIR